MVRLTVPIVPSPQSFHGNWRFRQLPRASAHSGVTMALRRCKSCRDWAGCQGSRTPRAGPQGVTPGCNFRCNVGCNVGVIPAARRPQQQAQPPRAVSGGVWRAFMRIRRRRRSGGCGVFAYSVNVCAKSTPDPPPVSPQCVARHRSAAKDKPGARVGAAPPTLHAPSTRGVP
jgi:hypothetical protein